MTVPPDHNIPDETLLSIVVVRLDDLKEQQRKDTAQIAQSVENLRQEMLESQKYFVQRSEWTQRNSLDDERARQHGLELMNIRSKLNNAITNHKEDIRDLRKEIDQVEETRKLNPLALISLLVSVLTVTIILIQAIEGQ